MARTKGFLLRQARQSPPGRQRAPQLRRRPRAHLQRLHSGLRSACSTGSPHSPSAPALSPSAPAGAATSAALPSGRSPSSGVGDPEAPGGRGRDSASVGASSCGGSMAGVNQAVALRERRRRGAPRAEESRPRHARAARKGGAGLSRAVRSRPVTERKEPIGQCGNGSPIGREESVAV